MIKIVIIEEQMEVRNRITSALSARGDLEVVAYGRDAYDALRLIGGLKPDIVILDNHLEYINGEEIPPLLRALSPSTAIVILTARISDLQLYKAGCNEVSGLVHTKTDMDALPSILKCVADGGCFISPSLAARVLHLFAIISRNTARLCPPAETDAKEKSPQHQHPTGYLSKTELQILTCIGEGNGSCEIAQNLHLTVGTVRNYISAVMHKTGLHSRAQLVLFALKYGLVSPGKR